MAASMMVSMTLASCKSLGLYTSVYVGGSPAAFLAFAPLAMGAEFEDHHRAELVVDGHMRAIQAGHPTQNPE